MLYSIDNSVILIYNEIFAQKYILKPGETFYDYSYFNKMQF